MNLITSISREDLLEYLDTRISTLLSESLYRDEHIVYNRGQIAELEKMKMEILGLSEKVR